MSDRELNQWIRAQEFMGLPGDVVAHFILGGVIGWVVFLVVGCSRRAVVAILVVSVGKEVFFDGYANFHQELYFEPLKDVFISVLGAFLILILMARPFRKRRFD